MFLTRDQLKPLLLAWGFALDHIPHRQEGLIYDIPLSCRTGPYTQARISRYCRDGKATKLYRVEWL